MDGTEQTLTLLATLLLRSAPSFRRGDSRRLRPPRSPLGDPHVRPRQEHPFPRLRPNLPRPKPKQLRLPLQQLRFPLVGQTYHPRTPIPAPHVLLHAAPRPQNRPPLKIPTRDLIPHLLRSPLRRSPSVFRSRALRTSLALPRRVEIVV